MDAQAGRQAGQGLPELPQLVLEQDEGQEGREMSQDTKRMREAVAKAYKELRVAEELRGFRDGEWAERWDLCLDELRAAVKGLVGLCDEADRRPAGRAVVPNVRFMIETRPDGVWSVEYRDGVRVDERLVAGSGR